VGNHELRLQVPLQPNINHKSSMFGGSLYCAAVLAGWGWLHLRLREAGIEDGHIVIHEGKIEYPLPVVDDAMAICSAPSPEAWERFESIYRPAAGARASSCTAASSPPTVATPCASPGSSCCTSNCSAAPERRSPADPASGVARITDCP